MIRNHRICFLMACLIWAGLFLVGCKDGKDVKDVQGAKVQGRLLEHGKPLKVLPSEEIFISFVAEDGNATESVASPVEFNAMDSTFVVPGPTGKGIPPGKYRIGLCSVIDGSDHDRFEQTFDSEITPLVAEVGSQEGQTFLVDLGTRMVTKQ